MITVTDLELSAIKAFRSTSLDCCGAFDDQGNMSYMNVDDMAKALEINKHSAAGLFGSLYVKNLIADMGESARGASCNDFVGDPELINPIIEASE